MHQLALFARLKAKAGKEEEVEQFLTAAVDAARAEDGTNAWFALKFDDSTFGIFDTFSDEAGRDAHLEGEIAAALMAKAEELLETDPAIEKVHILAAK